MLFVLTHALLLIILGLPGTGAATELASIPVSGTPETPVLLLDLGNTPNRPATADTTIKSVSGELAHQQEGISTQFTADDVASVHPGFGRWATAFRFHLHAPPSDKPYSFFARWRQGGDPNVCEQEFELWAGPDNDRMQRRATYHLKPKGWEFAWIAASTPVSLRADDTMIEIRNSGPGHDAKVFDAFLLSPPPPPTALPVHPGPGTPAFLLELGKTPQWLTAIKPDGLQILTGALTGHTGTGGAVEEKDEVQVLNPGFGAWGADFRFILGPAMPPGLYRFHARYKSGGEVSQVTQSFAIKAGSRAEMLVERANFNLTNSSPWEYQWLTATGTVPIFPGDRFLQITNAGKADGAKVFDAFLLQLETPLPGGMTASDAEQRNRFLALIKPTAHPERRLYVLDPTSGPATLFTGLSDQSVRSVLDAMQIDYRAGAEATAMAHALSLTSLPAALVTDANYSLLGSLAAPRTTAEVSRFLNDPQRHGKQPAIGGVPAEPSQPLHDGFAASWLVGGLQEGIAGLSILGLDAETVLRPNPELAYFSTEMMGGKFRHWQSAATAPDGTTLIADTVDHDVRWSGGTGYAHLYLHADRLTQGHLKLDFNGTSIGGWLDGRPLPLEIDGQVNLAPGWHSLLLKLVIHQDKGQRFGFVARFVDGAGKPLSGIRTRISDPDADLARNRIAARLRPLVYVDAPANLPHPGDPLKLRVDMRWHPLEPETALAAPIPRFPARLRVDIKDYSGKLLATREQQGLFPDIARLDFGSAPDTGYYGVYLTLHGSDGKLIMNYPPDGFSVIGGHAAQKERLTRKKLWNNDYYAFAEGNDSFAQPDAYFAWLERMGIYQSYGSYPGWQPDQAARWEDARQRGLNVFADTGGDSHWLNDTPETDRDYIAKTAAFTRYYKANNEIDTRRENEWARLRDPAHWVERAKREHDLVHQARPDGHYVGGSLVKPGDRTDNAGYPGSRGPGLWFEEVLKLGIDDHLDAWDVHAYPQRPPRFGGPIGNGDTEDERGVLAAHARLNRNNRLPFWLGEAGAKAAHGATGRRWQAEQAAKMIAWVNHRPDYMGLAFCLGHEYDLGKGRLWDYSMGHKPAEAALYTAGALVDGLPYRKAETSDSQIQAAWFGPTLMAWRADGKTGPWPIKLDAGQEWVLVDVVGRVENLMVAQDGAVDLTLGASPVYVLPKADYRQLVKSESRQ